MTAPRSRSSERPPILFLIFFGVVLLAILTIGGTLLYRGLFMDPAPRPTLQAQLEALPAVSDVRTESHYIPGSEPSRRATESWVTLGEELTSDPELTAERLAEVSFGFQDSHWSVEGSDSTADVRYLAPVDPTPIRWWAQAVTALDATTTSDAIHCDILDHALRCEVDSGDPEETTTALAALDGSAIGPWLDAAHADEGEEKGFSLSLGSQTWTDPTAIE